MRRQLGSTHRDSDSLPGFDIASGGRFNGHVGLPITAQRLSLALFGGEAGWDFYVLVLDCIALTFEVQIAVAILRFIPEMAWHVGIHATLPEGLYETSLEYFDGSPGSPHIETGPHGYGLPHHQNPPPHRYPAQAHRRRIRTRRVQIHR